MLIHLIPRIYGFPYHGKFGPKCTLTNFESPELGLLLDNTQLDTRHPYPNKLYSVACRKGGGYKALIGFLVDVDDDLVGNEFTTIARWSGGGRVLTHTVRTVILDHDHDAITWDMILWLGHHKFQNRVPSMVKESGWSPAHAQARMSFLTNDGKVGFDIRDCDEDGVLTSREETVYLHTVERERIANIFGLHQRRIPSIESAFRLEAPMCSPDFERALR